MVYQDKNKDGKVINKTKDGRSWYFRCYYTDMYGNRKQKKSIKYMSKSAAQDAERTFLNSIKYKDETDYNISFEYVYNDWWNYKKSRLKITSRYSIKNKIDHNIYEYFKDYKLHSIKMNIINQWKDWLWQKDVTDEHKNRIIGYMQEFLKYAVNNYNFDNKIAYKLQKEKISITKKNEEQLNYWTYDEFNKFINCVTNEIDKLMYIFLYYTGLRLGEMIALTWKDVDLKNKKLYINKTFSNKVEKEYLKDKNNKYIIIDPKTANSVRVIDLDDELVRLLKKHRLNEQKIYNFSESWFLFGNIKHIAVTTFKRHLDYWISIANVKHITPHGFRHSHASLLIYLGCDARDVANRLGDTVEVVESTYIHLFPEKKAITISKINDFVKK